ncbi:MAG TPA: hypothetical protein VK459_03670 [Polyangiaceae bacterium]|nr:hypothetical protein [Polyangiaceae bacterium]
MSADKIALPQAVIESLKTRQIAFFEARLTSPGAEEEWRKNVAAAYGELLDKRAGDLVDIKVFTEAVDAALSSEMVQSTLRPLAKEAMAALRREILGRRDKIGDHVDAKARTKLDALLERPKLFPDRLARELIKEEAVEEVMRDVLYQTLKEFSEKVNPFFADWGLPALLKKLSPFGLGGMKKGLDAFQAEFNRRLEPETRRFLQGFTGQGLRRMVEQMIAKSDEPKSIAVRKHLAAWMLEQEVASLVRSLDAEGVGIFEELSLDLVEGALANEALRKRRREVIEAAFEAHKDRSIREALAAFGAKAPPDVDVFARAAWPFARAILATPAARAWISQMIEEFYAEATVPT